MDVLILVMNALWKSVHLEVCAPWKYMNLESQCTLKVCTPILLPLLFLSKDRLLQQAPTYQIIYPSLTFRPNFCIPSPPFLVQEVMHRLIKHVNINKKCRVCTFFPFILLVIVILTFLHRWKEEWFIFLLIPNLHRETFISQCSRPQNC